MFSLFDKDEDGVVKVTEIGPMLRSVGFNPSETEIQRLQEEQDTDNGIAKLFSAAIIDLQVLHKMMDASLISIRPIPLFLSNSVSSPRQKRGALLNSQPGTSNVGTCCID